MTIERVIEKAVQDGGYEDFSKFYQGVPRWPEGLFLDHLFWQSLGKAMGWANEETQYSPHARGVHANDPSDGEPCFCDEPKDYLNYWHRFIDCLVSGKRAEEFFETL
ncbi:MAG: hypothetical protein LAN18_13320 [Acidobacteriia bacterium]|nr:hypothetical protein [Terriglobia bacterium]